MAWQNVNGIRSRKYTCGFCGNLVATTQGYFNNDAGDRLIYICPHCVHPTYFYEYEQIPGVPPGGKVAHVPDDLSKLYLEARRCCSVAAFTASVLISRKMLINIGVSLGASQQLRFIEYVEYLAANGYVPPNGKTWVDHIRTKGNEATHEIALMSKADAEELVAFVEMLLKFIYEFPARVPKQKP